MMTYTTVAELTTPTRPGLPQALTPEEELACDRAHCESCGVSIDQVDSRCEPQPSSVVLPSVA